MTEKHVFDDLDALRRAAAKDKKPSVKKVVTKTKGGRSKKEPKVKDGRYLKMMERQAVKGFTALGCQQALVWYAILYFVSVRRNWTVTLPNEWLAARGVSRWVKSRALSNLVGAKLVRITQFNKQSPRVTLL